MVGRLGIFVLKGPSMCQTEFFTVWILLIMSSGCYSIAPGRGYGFASICLYSDASSDDCPWATESAVLTYRKPSVLSPWSGP